MSNLKKKKVLEFIIKHGKRVLKIKTVKPSKLQIIKTYLMHNAGLCKNFIKLVTGDPEHAKIVIKKSLQLMKDRAVGYLSRFKKIISPYFHKTLKMVKVHVVTGWLVIPKKSKVYSVEATFWK